MKYIIAILSFGVILFSSCYYDNKIDLYGPDTDCNNTDISYSDVVLPIIEAKCYQCHDIDNYQSIGANINLEGHAKLKTSALSGSLLGTINNTGSYTLMPIGATAVSECNISKITTWVNEGAKNN